MRASVWGPPGVADEVSADEEPREAALVAWKRLHWSAVMVGGLLELERSGSDFSSSRVSQLVYAAKMVHVCMSLEWI